MSDLPVTIEENERVVEGEVLDADGRMLRIRLLPFVPQGFSAEFFATREILSDPKLGEALKRTIEKFQKEKGYVRFHQEDLG